MDDREKKKLIDKINKRITRAEKTFGFDDETKSLWREQLRDLVPDTDMLTKNGLLSMSQDSLAMMDDATIESLQNSLPQSISELKEIAEDSLYDLFMSDPDLETDRDAIIASEVASRIKVLNIIDKESDKSLISDTITEWRDSIKALDPMVEIEYPDLYEKISNLDTEITDLKKLTYSDIYTILNDAKNVLSDYKNRGK